MKAALLPDRGVVKVSGDDARKFLHGLVTADMLSLTPGTARFCALLTPQGKIIADFFVAEAPSADGGGFFLDVPRALDTTLFDKLNLYKLRAKVLIEDLSEILGVLAVWDGTPAAKYGLSYADPRLPALGTRLMIPPHRAADAAREIGASLVAAEDYEVHRIGLGVPRGGIDFAYGDAFPHEADMDQLGGVDFAKGCYVGQEVVSRIEHRGIARTRAVPIRYDGGAPENGVAITAGERQVGTMGSAARGRGIALLRLDRVAEATEPLTAGGVPIHLVKPDWARFSLPHIKAAE
ncbi:MAG TPA: folate-binding protein YgfZ [Xanthobacteraceae bacterium]|nr:folate-binding protein YgfZ [Xanthobacteraceae bacterium]